MPGRKVIIPNLHINSVKMECLDSFNFLGITIVKHLTWKEHINLIANKISRIVGFIHRLKHYIPQNVLLTIYSTLIIPHLSYGILTSGFNADWILKTRKKAVKSITLSKYNAHTEPIFKTLKLFKIEDILKCQTLKFCYKLLNGNLPVYFINDDWYSPISNIHCYKGFCQIEKIQKSEKNSEVGGWVQPQLGFLFFGGNFVVSCVFCVVFMFPKQIKKWIEGWVGGWVVSDQSDFFSDFLNFF